MKNQNAVALGKLGRSKNTEAQANASKENGKLGGRPKNKRLIMNRLGHFGYEYISHEPLPLNSSGPVSVSSRRVSDGQEEWFFVEDASKLEKILGERIIFTDEF